MGGGIFLPQINGFLKKKINDNLIRLKGIPTSCIEYHAEQENISVLDSYKRFYNNETIKFDLTNNGNKFVCRNHKNHSVYYCKIILFVIEIFFYTNHVFPSNLLQTGACRRGVYSLPWDGGLPSKSHTFL